MTQTDEAKAARARERALAELRPWIGDEGVEHLVGHPEDDAVHAMHALHQAAAGALDNAVLAARLEGRSWESIGQATNRTRQAAHERWRWTELEGGQR